MLSPGGSRGCHRARTARFAATASERWEQKQRAWAGISASPRLAEARGASVAPALSLGHSCKMKILTSALKGLGRIGRKAV